jgi:hypothetical protein
MGNFCDGQRPDLETGWNENWKKLKTLDIDLVGAGIGFAGVGFSAVRSSLLASVLFWALGWLGWWGWEAIGP